VTRASVPSYRFAFAGGLTQRGILERASPTIDEGRTRRFRYLLDDRPLAYPLGRPMPPEAADLIDVGTAIYLADPDAPWAGRDLVPLVALRELVERLRTLLASPRPFAALDAAFPTILDVVDAAPYLGLERSEVESALVRLFEAQVRDADAFFAGIDRPGWGRRGEVTTLSVPAGVVAIG
jgi:hypothetical protein